MARRAASGAILMSASRYSTPLSLRLCLLPGPDSAPLFLGLAAGHGRGAAVTTGQGRLRLTSLAGGEIVREAENEPD
jgi:hypothetical protein